MENTSLHFQLEKRQSIFVFINNFHLFSIKILSTSFEFVFQGYTIPLDKRLAADGRGLQQVHINENFSKLAEALYIADRKVFNIIFISLINRNESTYN